MRRRSPYLRQPGYIPFLRFMVRDFFAFQRQGLKPLGAARSAFEYWKHDRAIEKPW